MKLATLFCAAASANVAQFEAADLVARLSETSSKLVDYAVQADEYPERPCIKAFLTAIQTCVDVQMNHPFCKEDDPNFNGLMCAIVINKCLAEEMADITNCMN